MKYKEIFRRNFPFFLLLETTEIVISIYPPLMLVFLEKISFKFEIYISKYIYFLVNNCSGSVMPQCD